MTRTSITSVILPVFNGEAHIAAALNSILDQLSADDEVLVVDDASTDGTTEVVSSFLPRVTLLRGNGSGPAAARNIGLAVARGDFIAFLDHDDLWPRDRHRCLLSALLSDDGADAAVGRVRIQYDAPETDPFHDGIDGHHHTSILPSCLYRRRLIDIVGNFDPTLRYGEDYDYYLRQLETGMAIVQCDVDSLIYRRHDRNITLDAPPRSVTLLQVLSRKVARRRSLTSQSGM